jgi:hypothetical protein
MLDRLSPELVLNENPDTFLMCLPHAIPDPFRAEELQRQLCAQAPRPRRDCLEAGVQPQGASPTGRPLPLSEEGPVSVEQPPVPQAPKERGCACRCLLLGAHPACHTPARDKPLGVAGIPRSRTVWVVVSQKPQVDHSP